MYDGVMSNGYIIANAGTTSLIGAMYAGTILDINFIAHPNEIYVTSYHRIKPNTAIIPHYDIANNGGIWSNENIVTKLG
jgi:hypothetical protein